MKKILLLLIPFLIGCNSESENEVGGANKPVVKTLSFHNLTTTSFTVTGEIVSDNGKPVTTYGFCWSTAGDPIQNGNCVNAYVSGGNSSNFSLALDSLQENTPYYVRAYATNSDGTSYGTMLTVTTLSSVPVNFTTKEITDIAASSASTYLPEVEGLGNIQFTRGVCYGTTNNPTISNNLITGHVEDRYVMKNLTPNTTYYVRAYFTNTQTNVTVYGQNVTFTTLAPGTSPKGANYICDGVQITTVVPVTSITGRVWMDRNLGASKVLNYSDWSGSVGGQYQWGRGNDGHASILAEQIAGTSSTDTPGNDKILYGAGIPTGGSGPPCYGVICGSVDWRFPKNDNLWQGVNGINNPCPAGYRLPTKEEFQAELTAYNITTPLQAANSPLKLLFTTNTFYWTSSVRVLPEYGAYGFAAYGSFPISLESLNRAQYNGCVRCIQD